MKTENGLLPNSTLWIFETRHAIKLITHLAPQHGEIHQNPHSQQRKVLLNEKAFLKWEKGLLGRRGSFLPGFHIFF